MPMLNLRMRKHHADLLVHALMEVPLPLKQSHPLLQDIVQQMQEQMQALEAPIQLPDPQPAPTPVVESPDQPPLA